jgi:prolyl oligopeptidase
MLSGLNIRYELDAPDRDVLYAAVAVGGCLAMPPRLRPLAFALLVILAPWAASARAQAQARPYPRPPRDGTVDDYHGTRVPDPYRPLERLDAPATVRWVAAEERRTEATLAAYPGREAIRRRLGDLWDARHTDVPWQEAGRLFFTERRGRAPQPVLYTLGAAGALRVVLDPATLSSDGSVAIGDYAVSPDGRWLAYSRSAGGADEGETRVRSLADGTDQPDVVRGSWGSACWTFDGAGFLYMRPAPATPGQPADAPRIGKQLYYHTLGHPQADDRLLREWKENYRWLYCMLSDDGRWAFAVAERGRASWMYAMDLGDPRHPDLSAPLVPLLGEREAYHTPMGTLGDTLFAFTDLDAPRGRVVALDLRQGARVAPRTVVPETDDVIQSATVAGDRLAVHYLHDVRSRLLLFRLDGTPAGGVALPGIGAVGWPLNGRASSPELLYSYTSFLTPETVYRYDLRTGVATPFRAPAARFDGSAYETRQVFTRSKDGTRLPIFVTARKGLVRDGRHPTVLTGYGGYGLVRGPEYRPEVAAWLELGGVYALATIRGGGEYGETWHRDGMLDRKQHSFDDFIAAAEFLVAQRYTAPEHLGMYGHSNGGLLVGAVLTQRPDLFGAAVADAGHYDMLRYHRFTVGAGWIPEYGSPDDSLAFRWLRAYSPLHNVRPGTCYPATLLLTADHDDRVVPSHGYKFAAALQAVQACDRPVLLRVARSASHGYASRDAAIAQASDMLSFLAWRLGPP